MGWDPHSCSGGNVRNSRLEISGEGRGGAGLGRRGGGGGRALLCCTVKREVGVGTLQSGLSFLSSRLPSSCSETLGEATVWSPGSAKSRPGGRGVSWACGKRLRTVRLHRSR